MKARQLTEKMMQYGVDALTTEELLTLILGEEQAAYNAYNAGKQSLRHIAGMYPSSFKTIKGMTERKIAALMASLEIGRRKTAEELKEKRVMRTSTDSYGFLKEVIGDEQQEIFCVLFLNRMNGVEHFEKISVGGITGTIADPRIILKKALDHRAVSLILAHNHPSGSIKPSKADEDITYKIKEAAKFFEIKVLDHIIIGGDSYYSFADEGIM